MSDNAVDSHIDAEDADLKNALLAAFGADALDWLDEANDAQLGQVANPSTSQQAAAEFDLVFALDQLSLAKQDGLVDPTRAFEAYNKNLRNRSENSVRYVVFEVGDQRFGMPLDGVQEIERCGKVTVLPRTPEWLRGITNLRGKIFSVIDFRKLLKQDDDAPLTGEKIIVVQNKRLDTRTALAVDRVLGIRSLEAKPDSAKILSGPVTEFASGVSDEQDDSIVLIDPDLLLGCNDLKTFSDC